MLSKDNSFFNKSLNKIGYFSLNFLQGSTFAYQMVQLIPNLLNCILHTSNQRECYFKEFNHVVPCIRQLSVHCLSLTYFKVLKKNKKCFQGCDAHLVSRLVLTSRYHVRKFNNLRMQRLYLKSFTYQLF